MVGLKDCFWWGNFSDLTQWTLSNVAVSPSVGGVLCVASGNPRLPNAIYCGLALFALDCLPMSPARYSSLVLVVGGVGV